MFTPNCQHTKFFAKQTSLLSRALTERCKNALFGLLYYYAMGRRYIMGLRNVDKIVFSAIGLLLASEACIEVGTIFFCIFMSFKPSKSKIQRMPTWHPCAVFCVNPLICKLVIVIKINTTFLNVSNSKHPNNENKVSKRMLLWSLVIMTSINKL